MYVYLWSENLKENKFQTAVFSFLGIYQRCFKYFPFNVRRDILKITE
jgi:hypothetical protein